MRSLQCAEKPNALEFLCGKHCTICANMAVKCWVFHWGHDLEVRINFKFEKVQLNMFLFMTFVCFKHANSFFLQSLSLI